MSAKKTQVNEVRKSPGFTFLFISFYLVYAFVLVLHNQVSKLFSQRFPFYFILFIFKKKKKKGKGKGKKQERKNVNAQKKTFFFFFFFNSQKMRPLSFASTLNLPFFFSFVSFLVCLFSSSLNAIFA
jgi:hypothetical protein